MYVDKDWNIKDEYYIRDVFYKKRFKAANKDVVLKKALLKDETNNRGEQLYACAFSNQPSQQGPNHKDKVTESELEIDHKINVTEHWEKEGRFQTQEERNAWYDDPKHLQVLCESCNSSKSKGVYNKKVGEDFRGPKDRKKK